MLKQKLTFVLCSLVGFYQLGWSASTPMYPTDLDEDIQGTPTTVTRYNNCSEEKLKSYNPIPGTIPLIVGSFPSSDLVCDSDECGPGTRKGKRLTSFQAQAYFDKRYFETRCQWTLAELNPVEDPNIWVDKLGEKLDPSLDNIEIEDLTKVQYASKAWGRGGNFRLTVNKKNKFGVPKQYSMFLSKTIHNYTLRKSLLRKLGYKVPKIKWVKRVKIQFEDEQQLNDFKSDLGVNNAGSDDRWVLNVNDDLTVVVQDVLLMDDQEFDVNLAKGTIDASIAQGKRTYHSLLIPYALVEAPESINRFQWTFGRIFSDNLIVEYPTARSFDISFHDALWMTRRILKLSEKDWWEIVESTSLPPSVKLLMFEKLKSRVNHLAHLMGQDFIEFDVNTQISNQKDLVKGEIVQEFYDGYARRFKIPDPENPMGGNNFINFFKSYGMTLGIESAMTAINQVKILGTDIEEKIEEEIQEIVAEQALKGETGGKLPVKVYAFPTVRGTAIVSREIIAGGYLGAEQTRLQIADSVGGVISAGVFAGMTGVYTETGEQVDLGDEIVRQKVPVSISANAKVGLSRVYTHVRPIITLEEGLKYPVENMIVPLLKNEHADIFGNLLTNEYQNDFRDMEEGETYQAYQKRKSDGVAKMLAYLKDNIAVGESLIITDSLVGDINFQTKVNLYEIVDLKMGARPQGLVISRFHILRKSETEYHIYKSLGNTASIELTSSLQKYVPLTKVIYNLKTGVATTKFYKLNLGEFDDEGNENPYIFNYIEGLKEALGDGSLDRLDRTATPYTIHHDYGSESNKWGIFVWRWNSLGQRDDMRVIKPSGEEIKFFRRMEGSFAGRDYQSYSEDALKALVGELVEVDFNFSSFRAGNPGYTFHGKSDSVVTSFDAVETADKQLVAPVMKLSRVSNGWNISKKSAVSKIESINERYKFEYFNPKDLAQTKEIYFYNFNLNFLVKPEGLKYLVNTPKEKILKTWENFNKFPNRGRRGERLANLVERYNYNKEKNNKERMSELALSMFKTIEQNLTVEGMTAMFGGGRYFFTVGRIEGFRVGDESGDEILFGNTMGSRFSPGEDIISETQLELGASSGEYFLSWILGRIH